MEDKCLSVIQAVHLYKPTTDFSSLVLVTTLEQITDLKGQDRVKRLRIPKPRPLQLQGAVNYLQTSLRQSEGQFDPH